ncbi:NAD(P)H-dependent oxidoreductase [Streptococcus ratti]|uniref:NAD(P)H-flavin oxidoreductase n=1 Tax=Streptococcus ratti FA-1 = DSM 20564 TaxID=699248 RepID=A0ABP2QX55_STRRT|nr:NAD(P)H-dependent oxidoreductase [Streptococcus ratti]EJN93419.1 putative NAD(P)H-flavin oxidoreductase [Streptococcus ratti FA-1 = DSM 20564]EMP69481.1 NAD(P)H-flavin oxidoreductase [Streptococcus ratti FA-1 = DSM 20564]QEY07308.1 NAD(P)H-dependent oxidoreductase [Streptococcus ratti]VEI59745.1 NAD(P)H-flavin oxidoreductase [Streptococcus mutans]
MTKEDIKKQVRQAFDRRVAVRVYNDQKIPKDDMEFILDTAWLSPSSIGLEPWRFIVLEDEAVKKQLKEIAWGAKYQLETASHFVLAIASKDVRYDSENVRQSLIRRGIKDGEDLNSRLKLYQSFQESDLKLDSERALFDWAAKQTYIAMGNMMTAASMIGIDSCPIEGFDYDKANHILSQAGLINPQTEGIANMISFGYRLRDPKHPRSRKARKEVITWPK